MSKVNAWSNTWPLPYTYTHYNGVVGQYYRYAGTQSLTNSLSGRTLPGWRKLIARHQSATTGLVKVQNFGYLAKGQGFTRVKHSAAGVATLSEFGELCGSYCTAPGLDWSSVTAVQDKATAIFLKKVQKVNESELSGQVFTAEFGKAVRQLRSPFRALRAGMFDYLYRIGKKQKDRQFRALTSAQKLSVVGETWLEYSFGLMPTVMDLEAGLKLLDSLGNLDRFIKVRAIAGTSTGNGAAPINRYGTNSSCKFEVYTKNLTSNECLIVGEVYRPMSMVSPMGFAEKARFDFAEFIPTIYELCPYSWLLDYVTNVGDVLNTLAVDRSSIAWASRTTCMVGSKILSGRHNDAYQKTIHGPNYIASGGDFGISVRTSKRITRDVPSLDTPAFHLDVDLSPLKLLNVAGLAAVHVSTLNRLFGHEAPFTKIPRGVPVIKSRSA